MGLVTPIPNRFHGRITNRPAAPTTTWGTSVANSTANTYGSYTDLLGATTTYETFYLSLFVYGIGAATSNGDAIMSIGIDYSGGTSYTDVISHLVVSGAGTSAMGAVSYRFPLYIPSGARVAAKLSAARGAVTSRVIVDLFGKPSRPELVRAGSYVLTFGAVTASSRGTTVTPGTSAEGSVTTIATDSITDDVWWWQAGVGCSDTSMAGGGLFTTLDVGVGTSTSVLDYVIVDQVHAAWNTSEQTGMGIHPDHSYVFPVPGGAGLDVFARMGCTGTPDSGHSVAVYALGG